MRLSVPLFVRNANAQNLCLRENEKLWASFLSFIFHMRLTAHVETGEQLMRSRRKRKRFYMSLPRLYPKKARSARLLGCKRPRDGLQSLPPFWEPYFLQTPLFRFPPDGEKTIMRRCCSSSEKSHVVAPVKITIAFARLFLLRLTTNFFRQSVPPFARNAVARSFCLR